MASKYKIWIYFVQNYFYRTFKMQYFAPQNVLWIVDIYCSRVYITCNYANEKGATWRDFLRNKTQLSFYVVFKTIIVYDRKQMTDVKFKISTFFTKVTPSCLLDLQKKECARKLTYTSRRSVLTASSLHATCCHHFKAVWGIISSKRWFTNNLFKTAIQISKERSFSSHLFSVFLPPIFTIRASRLNSDTL